MSDKEKDEDVKFQIKEMIQALEEDGFSEKNKRKYQICRLEKEVIWPIDNKSVYKIVFSVSKYRIGNDNYSLSIKLSNKRGASIIYGDIIVYNSEPDSIYKNILCAIINIVNVACFLTKLIPAPKGEAIGAEILVFDKDDVSIYYELEDSLFVGIDFKEKKVYVFIWEASASTRTGKELGNVIDISPDYLRKNYKKLFPKKRVNPKYKSTAML